MTQAEALSILKTGANVFLTGEPGSGKTHTINAFVTYLRTAGIEPAITASTGIAATHIGGMTIHSWSGIGIKKTLDKYALDKIATTEYLSRRIRAAKILIIDEISMLLPSMLDMVDAVLREVKQSQEPFGGIQVIFVGDFFQLPPIQERSAPTPAQDLFDETPARFAYESSAWVRAKPIVCYLTEQHRQDDDTFLSVLSAIRSNDFDEAHLEHIESRRCAPDVVPKDIPRLFSHNMNVDGMNNQMLGTLAEKAETFSMVENGTDALVASLKKGCLSPEQLTLKVGASVMFTKNSPRGGFVNGTLGTVIGFAPISRFPIVETREGRRIEAERMEWSIEENGRIKAKVNQVPLRLAWAITVHKSQGMSLDEAVMDLSSVFEYGQGYVALSRVRRLSGLHIIGYNRRAFEVHPDILEADHGFRSQSEEAVSAFDDLGADVVAKMHADFIKTIGGSIGSNPKGTRVQKPAKPDTREETFRLWREGKTIDEIADARNLKPVTIFGHIEDLVGSGAITQDEVSKIAPPALVKNLPAIHGVFKKLDTTSLSPVFEYFHGTYSYDDLRIARMLLGKKS